MTEEKRRKHRACFTGHRPEKLHREEEEINEELEKMIKAAIGDGYTTFISGMARGVDIWAAEIVLMIKDYNPEIKLICAVPYEGFEKSWSKEWQDAYHEVLDRADLVEYICPHYSRGCFQIRNKWMVDHSDVVIAVYNGEKGGTKNTIDYAKKAGVEVRVLEG